MHGEVHELYCRRFRVQLALPSVRGKSDDLAVATEGSASTTVEGPGGTAVPKIRRYDLKCAG